MKGGESLVLDLRIYRIKPGKAVDFDFLVREETVPLARRFGHRIVAFGPSLEDDHVYLLVRAFRDAEDRRAALDLLYGSREWTERYDYRVGEMLVSFETVVLPGSSRMVDSWIESDPGTVRLR